VSHGGEIGKEGEKSNRADKSDIAVGNVLPPGGGANVARMAQLYSGIPYT
jgi:acetyl-CoA acyltransferase 1